LRAKTDVKDRKIQFKTNIQTKVLAPYEALNNILLVRANANPFGSV
jgi:hypothetical protein